MINIKCPFCSFDESKVVDSRPTEENSAIRRRRECLSCSKRFTTYEKHDHLPILVVKKDGRRETFDSTKIMNGLLKACEKRPVSIRDLEVLTESIEKQVYNSMEQEVSSQWIGQILMQELKKIDEVAYVRFASVYRQFRDINTFMDELNKILKEK